MAISNGLHWPLCWLGVLTEPVARIGVNPLHIEPVFRGVAEPVVRLQRSITNWGATPFAAIRRREIPRTHGAVRGPSGAFLIVVALTVVCLLDCQLDPNIWALRIFSLSRAILGFMLLVVPLDLFATNGAIAVTARGLARKIASLFGVSLALRGYPGATCAAVGMEAVWTGAVAGKVACILRLTVGRAIGMNTDFGSHRSNPLMCDYDHCSTDWQH